MSHWKLELCYTLLCLQQSKVEIEMMDKMLKYMSKENYTITTLLEDADIDVIQEDYNLIYRMTLCAILMTYCSPGYKFGMDNFKLVMKEYNIQRFNAMKQYTILHNLMCKVETTTYTPVDMLTNANTRYINLLVFLN